MIKLNENLFDSIQDTTVPDVVTEIEEKEINPPGPTIGEDTGLSDLLLSLINDESNAIRQYLMVKANLGSHSNFSSVIDDIMGEEMNHIGMIQSLLAEIAPNAALIDQGKEEAKDILINESCSSEKKESKKLKEAINEKIYFKAFITDLSEYNDGNLVGEWVDFPIDREEFFNLLTENILTDPNHEWFVTDYDVNLDSYNAYANLGEYPGYDALNEEAELLFDCDKETLENVLEVNSSLREAIDGINDGTYRFIPGITSEYDLGYYVIDNYYDGTIPEDALEDHFDYGALGRDLRFDFTDEDEQFENMSDEEIGEDYVNSVGIEGIRDIDNYFDYSDFGRELLLDTYTLTKDGVVEEII